MKSKFLSIIMLALMSFTFMSVSNSTPDSELESARKFWGSEESTETVCGDSNTGTFCCTTTTTTTSYVFWIQTSISYEIDVDCI